MASRSASSALTLQRVVSFASMQMASYQSAASMHVIGSSKSLRVRPGHAASPGQIVLDDPLRPAKLVAKTSNGGWCAPGWLYRSPAILMHTTPRKQPPEKRVMAYGAAPSLHPGTGAIGIHHPNF